MKVDVNGNTYWFSYETCIAFRSPKTGMVCLKNYWSTTTGRHMNALSDKSDRVDYDEFNRQLAVAHGHD